MLDRLVDAHADLTAELTHAISDHAEVAAAVAKMRAQAWADNSHLGVTERREAVAWTVSEYVAEEILTRGRVEELRAKLQHTEFSAGMLMRVADAAPDKAGGHAPEG